MPELNNTADLVSKKLKKAYQNIFGDEAKKESANLVLDDLSARFFAYHSTFSDNPYVTAKNEGNRQVILHILGMTARSKHMSTEDIEGFLKRD